MGAQSIQTRVSQQVIEFKMEGAGVWNNMPLSLSSEMFVITQTAIRTESDNAMLR